ncbi:hypothetical protein [Marinoscillum furvescens]|uniref:Uncharacterized protein n=1 Tax=Marinoscillum furvescens DSM 4134 TaxID=1122208 RepID=A0A3D9L5I1_MARFU|nr:hypothetical protein [Marinoscillum furvescens]REE01262.1 hypothetical protein C7460_104282 [Marinoscillum furvescens DSM 4134]
MSAISMDTTDHSTEIAQALEEMKNLGFQQRIDGRFAAVFTTSDEIACILKESYVPIDEFKKVFVQMVEIARGGSYHKFIFDKRALTTFHQPTMEWYFLHWKREMLQLGVSKHRKILPNLRWFEQAVAIARNPLLEQFSAEERSQLDIKYCNTLEEAHQS